MHPIIIKIDYWFYIYSLNNRSCPTAPSTIGTYVCYFTCQSAEPPELKDVVVVFFDSNDGLAGCAPVPQTGVLMLVSTCLLYFPTTMTLLYVYGTVFHSHSSSQRLVPTTRSAVKAVSYQCNDHCTDGYCNVRSLLVIIIVITSETRFLASSPHKNEKKNKWRWKWKKPSPDRWRPCLWPSSSTRRRGSSSKSSSHVSATTYGESFSFWFSPPRCSGRIVSISLFWLTRWRRGWTLSSPGVSSASAFGTRSSAGSSARPSGMESATSCPPPAFAATPTTTRNLQVSPVLRIWSTCCRVIPLIDGPALNNKQDVLRRGPPKYRPSTVWPRRLARFTSKRDSSRTTTRPSHGPQLRPSATFIRLPPPPLLLRRQRLRRDGPSSIKTSAFGAKSWNGAFPPAPCIIYRDCIVVVVRTTMTTTVTGRQVEWSRTTSDETGIRMATGSAEKKKRIYCRWPYA